MRTIPTQERWKDPEMGQGTTSQADSFCALAFSMAGQTGATLGAGVLACPTSASSSAA